MFSLDLDAFNFYKNDIDIDNRESDEQKFDEKYDSLMNGFNIIIIEKT